MKIKIHPIVVLLFCLGTSISFSQDQKKEHDKKMIKANAQYDIFSFFKARKGYEQLVKNGYKSAEIYGRLGDTYFFNADYALALQWYKKMMEESTSNPPQYYHRYAVCLRANNQYEQGFEIMSAFYEKMGKKEEAEKWNPEVFFNAIEQQSNRYDNVSDAGINSPYSDFGAALVPNEAAIKQALEIAKIEKREKARILKENAERRKREENKLGAAALNKNRTNDKDFEKTATIEKKTENQDNDDVKSLEKLPKYSDVIYATAKDSGIFKRRHSWNDRPFLKLYSAQIDEQGKLYNEKKLTGEINSKYHQSTPVLTNDGLTMYFTRQVPYNKTKIKTDGKPISHLKIFQAQKVDNKWTNIKELPAPINLAGTSSAHPALSPDNSELYFASNRKKDINDTDLYVVERKKGGGFAFTAKALGDEINTYGRETFPFVDNSGILYFSSDGHPSLGGLDIFAAVKDDKGKYIVVNLGKPTNSANDDFAYAIDSDSKKGFLSSNREEGKGDDDLYTFLETKPIVFPFKLNPVYSGVIKDSLSGKILPKVEITVFNELNEKIKTIVSDESGKYTLDLLPLKSHSFEFRKEGYATERIFVDGLKIAEKKEIPIRLFNELSVIVDNEVVKLSSGDNLTDKLKLNPIYFDYGGYAIRKSSKLELDKLINLMKGRDNISIEVRSHTDSRGRDDFNMKLSKNRAKTTIDYIVTQGGISKDRVWGDGYGETQLINKCGNGVKCSEKEHELNRRSEFIIIIKNPKN